MKIDIKSSDRVLVCGQTGSGKSVLVNNLILPQLMNYVVYDYKHEIELPEAVIFHRISDFSRQPNSRRIIYRTASGSDNEFDALCKQVFYRGKNTLLLDELSSHCTPGKIVPHHDIIMRLGRSKGVGCINLTQRPRYIHNNVISQCEHFFIFDLLQETDRKKLAEFCGEAVLQRATDFHFWYFNVKMKEPILHKPIKI